MKESDLEKILQVTLARVHSSIENGDPHSANYWLLQHIKDVNEYHKEASTKYLLSCAERYQSYVEFVENMFLGDKSMGEKE